MRTVLIVCAIGVAGLGGYLLYKQYHKKPCGCQNKTDNTTSNSSDQELVPNGIVNQYDAKITSLFRPDKSTAQPASKANRSQSVSDVFADEASQDMTL